MLRVADLDILLRDFIAAVEAGADPDPAALLATVPNAGERQELAVRIDSYLMEAPRRAWDPDAYERSAAKVAVDRVYESLEGLSGSWPELLPRLRNAARIRRQDLVERLAGELGFRTSREVQKIGVYYHRMEHGLLPAEGVSGRVIEALAGIVGASAETIREAGAAAGPRGSATPGPAFARVATPDPAYAGEGAGDDESAGAGSSPPRRDAIDALFTGG